MSSSKTFNINVKPRDVLVDLKGVSPAATNAYIRFWMLHALHGEPLPPREEKIGRDEWDAWFRDKLDMKNVRSWITPRDELIALGKIRVADDGRLYIGRTMRDAEKRRGGDPSRWDGEGDDDQGALDLQGVHPAQRQRGTADGAQKVVEKPVEQPGEILISGEVRPKFGQTSPDVRPTWRPKCLIFHGTWAVSSCSESKSIHEFVVVSHRYPRARGDPASLQA